MSIRTRLFQGVAANGFGQIVAIVIQLVSVPIFIKFWGVELYGEWLLINTIPAYLNMSDIGFTTITANEMTMLVSRNDRSKALGIFQSTWVLLCFISAFMLVIALSVTWFIPMEVWFNFKHVAHLDLVIIVILLSLYVIVGLQTRLLMAGFRCEGRYALGTFLSTLFLLIEYLVVAIVVYSKGSPIHAALSFLIMRIIGTICIKVISYKNMSWIVYGFRNASFSTIRKLARPSFSFMAFPLGNLCKDQGLIAVIGFFLGSASVVMFATTRTIVNAGYQLMTMINHAVWPEMSMAYGNKNMEVAKKLHSSAFKVSVILTFFFAVGLFFTGELIIKTWTLGKVIIPADFLYLMLCSLMANALWYTSSMIPIAINRHEKMTIFYLVVTSILLLTSFWIIPMMKLNGAALVSLCIHLLMSYYVIRLALSLLDEQLPDFIRSLTTLRL